MDLESIFTSFFVSTYTQADARRRLNALDIVFEESSYKTGEKTSLETLIKQREMDEEDKSVLLKFLSSIKLPADTSDLKKVFTGLKEEILRRPVVTLTVAFEPNREQVVSYGEWFRKNLHPKALVTIVFSAQVVGGCSITWEGKQVTYDIEYLLKARKDDIMKIVDKYAQQVKKEKVI